ncbi:MAG TPA: hypothetical protein P5144_13465 [Thermoanaerobaculia bacterium]|nr:hypothetical protein [Thermoanaerobaculia bacterium]
MSDGLKVIAEGTHQMRLWEVRRHGRSLFSFRIIGPVEGSGGGPILLHESQPTFRSEDDARYAGLAWIEAHEPAPAGTTYPFEVQLKQPSPIAEPVHRELCRRSFDPVQTKQTELLW